MMLDFYGLLLLMKINVENDKILLMSYILILYFFNLETDEFNQKLLLKFTFFIIILYLIQMLRYKHHF